MLTAVRRVPTEGAAPALFVQADLSTAEGVEQLARAVLDRLGSVDILVNTLGGSSSPAGGVLDDIARVAVFLASDEAGWLTGEVIFAGGGHK